MGHIKVVVGVLSAGEGIGAACVLTQELAVLILLGVLLCPQKQHVFTEVGHAGDVCRVRERSYEKTRLSNRRHFLQDVPFESPALYRHFSFVFIPKTAILELKGTACNLC